MQRSTLYIVIASIAIILFLGIWGYFYLKSEHVQVPVNTNIEEEYIHPHTRSLDGVGVELEVDTNRKPVAFMIDNSSDARPSVGIENASLVYETIAEGSITRQLAIFDPANMPDIIGPIRSLRPYYLAWAKEVGAIVVHVGGSPEALLQVTNEYNINEFFSGQFFWRDKSRSAPHNVFTSNENIKSAVQLYDYPTTTDILSWAYATTSPVFATKADRFSVDFSIDEYRVDWEYDAEKGLYNRTVDGILEDVLVKNVIVQVVDVQVLDAELRRLLDLTGSDVAWVMRDGTVTIGHWIKGTKDKRTMFIDSEGNDISIAPGMTWVQVIDDVGRVSF